VIGRRKLLWIVFGIIIGVLVIVAIVVPTSIILTKKKNKTTTSEQMTQTTDISTTQHVCQRKMYVISFIFS
jgi:flagellar basal body-associated protein FliL